MTKHILSMLLSVVLVGVTLSAQAAVSTPEPQAVAAAPAASQGGPSYVIGTGDVLAVKVFDEPSLTNKFAVDSDGTITFPFLQRVPVQGKTLREVEEILTSGLRAGYVNRAQVSVEIAEYRSRSIFVLGEVRNPGKYNIEGPVTLLEVIAKAGSFTPAAGPTLIVQRYKDGMNAAVSQPATPGGAGTAELLRVDIEDLKQGRFTANFLLQDSDTIIVQPADRYYVTGFVKTPGSFVLRRGMTVAQAIAEAGGLTERGSARRIKITRKVKGKDTEIDANMSDLVMPNDTIKVPQRLI